MTKEEGLQKIYEIIKEFFGNGTSVCDYCKAEWLNKEWEG